MRKLTLPGILLLAPILVFPAFTEEQARDRVSVQYLQWSPDGKRILFSALTHRSDWSDYSDEKWILYELKLNDHSLLKLHDATLYSAYSPDSKEIVVSHLREGDWELVILDRKTLSERVLTSNRSKDLAPSWSPDGNRIVYCSDREGPMQIYVMNRDGSGQERIASGGTHQLYNPEWSPDGKSIVYYLEKGDGKDQLFVWSLETAKANNITKDDGFNNIFPGWTPDGDVIYAAGAKNEPSRIFMVKPDGQNKREWKGVKSFYARMAPDGGQIAYISEENGMIYRMDIDGASPEILFDGMVETLRKAESPIPGDP